MAARQQGTTPDGETDTAGAADFTTTTTTNTPLAFQGRRLRRWNDLP